MAVTQIVLHEREHLGIIKPEGRVLFLNLLYFADEIASSRGLPIPRQNETLDDDEIAMAEQLVDRMTESFTPEKYQDDYRHGLLTLIDKKRDGTRLRNKPQPQPKPTEDGDLVEMLKASLDRVAGRQKRLAA